MKKIINGKMYNTETAKLIGEWGNGYNRIDFHWTEEDLYKKKNGEYFLHGAGGAMSKYQEPCGNGWSGSDKIIKMTPDEARKWAEEHLTADQYIEEFGEPEE